MTTRRIKIGNLYIGGSQPVVVQSMCATKTRNIEATALAVNALSDAGAGIIRVAVDTPDDAHALAEIRKRTKANLSVDLQENYRLAEQVAPFVDKIRYNPGHLHHTEPERDWREKVRWLCAVASDNDVALRIGINCGSIDPAQKAAVAGQHEEKSAQGTEQASGQVWPQADAFYDPLLQSALEHADFLDSIGFTRYCVSIKDSDPETVIAVNRRFRTLRPEIPLHLGVTEAGMPPVGVLKSRWALERLLADGIGETLRVSLTVESDRKFEEVEAGKLILANVAAGTIYDSSRRPLPMLNIVSCPSCSRVENGAFVALAQEVRQATAFASDVPLTIAVMGCRVNGPGETDDADFGLWCGADRVNFKIGGESAGSWPYEKIVGVLVERIRQRIGK